MSYELNYIWIGPYKGNSSDVDGPISMSLVQNSDYKINFWCLEQFQNQYKRHFSRQGYYAKEITVISIETYIKSLSSRIIDHNEKMLLNTARIFINQIADKVSSCYIRDIVNAKNLISLLLLYYRGGFIADSSIHPLTGGSQISFQNPIPNVSHQPLFPVVRECLENINLGITFYRQEKSRDWARIEDLRGNESKVLVHESMFVSKIEFQGIRDKRFIDRMIDYQTSCLISPILECWFMYSPPGHKIAKDAFEYYVRYLPILYETMQNVYQKKCLKTLDKSLYFFHKESAGAIIGAIVNALAQNGEINFRRKEFGASILDLNETSLFRNQSIDTKDRNRIKFTLPQQNVYKVYGNSHHLRELDEKQCDMLYIKYFSGRNYRF